MEVEPVKLLPCEPEGKYVVSQQIGSSFVKILMDAKRGVTEIFVLIGKRWVKQSPPTST